MNPFEQLDAEFVASDPYARLHDDLAENDDQMIEALVAMRKRKGLTQGEVAERMKRSKTAVSNFERLGADPHLSTIRRYAAAVGASITSEVLDYDRLDGFFKDGGEVLIPHDKTPRNVAAEPYAGIEIEWSSH